MIALVVSSGQALGINGGTSSAVDTTGSNLIVLSVSKYDLSAVSVSDSKGNVWTPLTARGIAANSNNRLYYCASPTVGTGHTFTATGSSVYVALGILAFSGAHATPFDVENGTANGASTSANTGSITPAEDNELVIASISTDATSGKSIDSGFTFIDVPYGGGVNMGGGIAYKIQGALAAENPLFSWTTNSTSAASIAGFKSAASAAPTWGVPKLGTLVEDATGNFDLIEPAGVAQGDLMVACIAYRGNAAITLPAGWATVATAQNSGDTDATNGIASGVMAYIVRGSSAPALTCTRTLGDVVLARIISYSGGSRFPYDTGSANTLGSASATATTGTITTAEANELLIAMTAAGDTYLASAFDATDPATASGATDTTSAPTAGTWIERQDSSTGTGADTGLAIADAIKATAGATGTIQATIAGSAQHVMIVGAFKIAPAPGRIYMTGQSVNRSNTF